MPAVNISDPQKLTYRGYTFGGKVLPTLYFEEGRYTQEHSKPTNVGWHVKRKNYFWANLPEALARDLKAQNYTPDVIKKTMNDKGKYDGADARLFEYSSNDGMSWVKHISRGHLICPGDKDYNSSFDAKYALKQTVALWNKQNVSKQIAV